MAKKKKNIPLPELSTGINAVDTHCHLDMAAYKTDLDDIISRAQNVGVSRIVTIGIDLRSSEKAVELASQYNCVYATVGVHPHDAKDFTAETEEKLKHLALQKKVVAYGEIGLDFVKEYSPKETQLDVFKRQVAIAKKLHLPLIIHDREAHDQIYQILKDNSPFPEGGIIHCFSSDASDARRFMELGFLISIPGVVTFNKAELLQNAVREIPIESLLIETDGPFLAPVPKRGKRNEPSYVLYTAAKLAEIKGISLDELVIQTTLNANKLFSI
jgi:TatD DNase family protein